MERVRDSTGVEIRDRRLRIPAFASTGRVHRHAVDRVRLGGRASYARKASRRTKTTTSGDTGALWGDLTRHVNAAIHVAAHLEKLSKDSIGRARAARIHRALGHIYNDARKMHLYG